jgi:hypothetical protein
VILHNSKTKNFFLRGYAMTVPVDVQSEVYTTCHQGPIMIGCGPTSIEYRDQPRLYANGPGPFDGPECTPF